MLVAATYFNECDGHFTVAIEDNDGELDHITCRCEEYQYECGHDRIYDGDIDPIDGSNVIDYIRDMGYRVVGQPVVDIHCDMRVAVVTL